jgi:hypothetical protein
MQVILSVRSLATKILIHNPDGKMDLPQVYYIGGQHLHRNSRQPQSGPGNEAFTNSVCGAPDGLLDKQLLPEQKRSACGIG